MRSTLGLTLWKRREAMVSSPLSDWCPPGSGNKEPQTAPKKGMSNSVKGKEVLPGAMTSELGLEE